MIVHSSFNSKSRNKSQPEQGDGGVSRVLLCILFGRRGKTRL